MLIWISPSIASPHLTAKNGNNESSYRRTLLPDTSSFFENPHGSYYFWNRRRSPNFVTSVPWFPVNSFDTSVKKRTHENMKRPPSQSSVVFRDNSDTSSFSPNSVSPSRNEHEKMTNAWFDRDGIEQRMLLPQGRSVPKEMYGPNYIWDTKGWPRLAETNPQPMYNHVKNTARNKLRKDSPIIFRENPPSRLHFPNINVPQKSTQNNYQNKVLEQNPKSLSLSDGLDQRMLLPEGRKIPSRMFGPNYIWDTKGWPRLVGVTPEPKHRSTNSSVKSNLKEPRVIFG